MFIASAIGLYFLVSVFARGTETESRWKILFIALASGSVLALVSQAPPGFAGFLLAVFCALGAVAAGLVLWCRVDRATALKIAISYFGLCVCLMILFGLLHAYLQ